MPPPAGYWEAVQTVLKKQDILLIADEVVTGFGRLGSMFGSTHYRMTPDIITIAKGLSSGYQPIGASVVSDEIASVIGSDEFNHGYTYSGHPVAAAAGLAARGLAKGHLSKQAGAHVFHEFEKLIVHAEHSAAFQADGELLGKADSVEITPAYDALSIIAPGRD